MLVSAGTYSFDTGAVLVILGKTRSQMTNIDTSGTWQSSWGYRIIGESAAAYFGTAQASAGEFDND
jgi:hypothetical protein